jgi:hypothetical protein
MPKLDYLQSHTFLQQKPSNSRDPWPRRGT